MFALAMLPVRGGLAQAAVDVSVSVPPPDLPVYDQPPLPGDGYLWTPGYWAWNPDNQDYYWVPGTWVMAPEADYLWTPGYWAVSGALFLWQPGYWGPRVGFYGGVDYGYGYGGHGYQGGYWQGGHVFYNRSVNNLANARVTNVYNKAVTDNVTVGRVSYNGGDGIQAQPNSEERAAGHDRHIGASPAQQQQTVQARNDPAQHFNRNQGKPPVAATPRPGFRAGTSPNGVPAPTTQRPPLSSPSARPPSHPVEPPHPPARPAEPPRSP